MYVLNERGFLCGTTLVQLFHLRSSRRQGLLRRLRPDVPRGSRCRLCSQVFVLLRLRSPRRSRRRRPPNRRRGRAAAPAKARPLVLFEWRCSECGGSFSSRASVRLRRGARLLGRLCETGRRLLFRNSFQGAPRVRRFDDECSGQALRNATVCCAVQSPPHRRRAGARRRRAFRETVPASDSARGRLWQFRTLRGGEEGPEMGGHAGCEGRRGPGAPEVFGRVAGFIVAGSFRSAVSRRRGSGRFCAAAAGFSSPRPRRASHVRHRRSRARGRRGQALCGHPGHAQRYTDSEATPHARGAAAFGRGPRRVPLRRHGSRRRRVLQARGRRAAQAAELRFSQTCSALRYRRDGIR
mmetsp:Transcript_16066/g.57132  ORF Transcript_16066/g.57132 Transcript_16066/m.57132 type:complete len:353 (+) Transcript_16066:765-1823(+)